MESLNIILENTVTEYSLEEKMKFAEEKNEIYRGLLSDMSPDDLMPGVNETLDLLKASGCSLAIGSSSKNAKFILNKLGIADFFDAVSDGAILPAPSLIRKSF